MPKREGYTCSCRGAHGSRRAIRVPLVLGLIAGMALWAPGPARSATLNVDLDGDGVAESKLDLNFLSGYPLKVRNMVTNNAPTELSGFSFSWPTAAPGGFSGATVASSVNSPVGVIWEWQTTRRVYPLACDSSLAAAADRRCTSFIALSSSTSRGPFAGAPGSSLSPSGSTPTTESITTSLLTFFSPQQRLFDIRSSVTQLTTGHFEFETKVFNFTGGTLTVDFAPGPLGCDTCIDLGADPKNCGACGNVCEPSECCAISPVTGEAACLPNDGGSCSLCGNGVIDEGEQCDGEDIGETGCGNFEFCGGSLGCTSECTFDTSLCESRCGVEDCCLASQCVDSSGGFFCSPTIPLAPPTQRPALSLRPAQGVTCDDEGLNACACEFLAGVCATGKCVPDQEGSHCSGGPRAGEFCSFDAECGACTSPASAEGAICAENKDCATFPEPLCKPGDCVGGTCATGQRVGRDCEGDFECGVCISPPEVVGEFSCGSNADCGLGLTGGPGPRVARSAAAPAPRWSLRALPHQGTPAGTSADCQISESAAKEVTSQVIVCGDGIPEGDEQCSDGRFGVRGTFNVFVPDTSHTVVFPSGPPLVSIRGVDVHDASGDGLIEPGERVELFVPLVNAGPGIVSVVNGVLSSADADLDGDGITDRVQVRSPNSTYPDIRGIVPQGSDPACGQGIPSTPVPSTNRMAFVVDVPGNHPEDTARRFDLDISGRIGGPGGPPFDTTVSFSLGITGACVPGTTSGDFDSLSGFKKPMESLVPSGDDVPFPKKEFKRHEKIHLEIRMACSGIPVDNTAPAPGIVALTRDGTAIDLSTVDLNADRDDNSLLFEAHPDEAPKPGKKPKKTKWEYSLRTRDLEHGTYILTIETANGQRYDAGFELKD